MLRQVPPTGLLPRALPRVTVLRSKLANPPAAPRAVRAPNPPLQVAISGRPLAQTLGGQTRKSRGAPHCVALRRASSPSCRLCKECRCSHAVSRPPRAQVTAPWVMRRRIAVQWERSNCAAAHRDPPSRLGSGAFAPVPVIAAMPSSARASSAHMGGAKAGAGSAVGSGASCLAAFERQLWTPGPHRARVCCNRPIASRTPMRAARHDPPAQRAHRPDTDNTLHPGCSRPRRARRLSAAPPPAEAEGCSARNAWPVPRRAVGLVNGSQQIRPAAGPSRRPRRRESRSRPSVWESSQRCGAALGQRRSLRHSGQEHRPEGPEQRRRGGWGAWRGQASMDSLGPRQCTC